MPSGSSPSNTAWRRPSTCRVSRSGAADFFIMTCACAGERSTARTVLQLAKSAFRYKVAGTSWYTPLPSSGKEAAGRVSISVICAVCPLGMIQNCLSFGWRGTPEMRVSEDVRQRVAIEEDHRALRQGSMSCYVRLVPSGVAGDLRCARAVYRPTREISQPTSTSRARLSGE